MTKKTKIHNNITEMVFILDRSGSMAGLEKDTIGGFNSLIEKQKIDKWNGEVPKIQGSDTSTIVDTRDMTSDEDAE